MRLPERPQEGPRPDGLFHLFREVFKARVIRRCHAGTGHPLEELPDFGDDFREDAGVLGLQLDPPGGIEAVAMEQRVHLCRVERKRNT
jgi:hypothetical protein